MRRRERGFTGGTTAPEVRNNSTRGEEQQHQR